MSHRGSTLSRLSPEQRAQLEKQLLQRPSAGRKDTIPRRSRDLPCALSHAQQRLWFLDHYEPGSPLYNIPMALELKGPLDIPAFESALDALVARHESLRTTFATLDDAPVQVVASGAKVPFAVIDLSSTPKAERKAELARLLNEHGAQPFDLSRDVMLRGHVYRLDADEYVLLLVMHHIASDGWSIDILMRELGVLYAAFLAGTTPALPELRVQYADFSIWQREWLSGPVLQKQVAYWRERLAGMAPVLEIPTDAPRHTVTGSRSGTQTLALSAGLSHRLEDLARAERATLFMTLLAAFQVLLGRLSGLNDVVVGAPIAGRNREDVEGLIGFFVNTLVLRADLSGDPTFRDVLRRVRETTLEAYANQDLPFEKLVEELHPDRSLHRTPLFQVFFNMLNTVGERLQLSHVQVQWLAPPTIDSKFDLTLYARPRPEGVLFTAVYNAELFSARRTAELLQQLERLLTAIADDPDQRIDRYPLVTPSAEIVLPDPTQPLSSGSGLPVHEQFARQAEKTPAQIAVVDPAERWTYGELDIRSNQLAHRLIELGVQPGTVVAVYAHRSASIAWAMLGAWKAGGAFLILDPALPAARLIECLKIARPVAWLQLDAAGQLPELIVDCLSNSNGVSRLEIPTRSRAAAEGFLADRPTTAPNIRVAPDHPAYVAFTSGSTGAPKGLLGTHGPLSHFLSWHVERFDLSAADRYSLLSGLAHDPLLRDVFTPLVTGATLVIPDPDDLGSERLALWMRREKITVAHLTPAMGQVLAGGVRSAERTGAAGAASSGVAMASLRRLFFGGDRLTRHDVDVARNWAPRATCVNFYGTTETPQAVAWHEIENLPDTHHNGNRSAMDVSLAAEVVPLGWGIDDVQLLVLNTAGMRCGIGEVGEINVRTPHLTKGYLNDESLTRKRFLQNPFSGQPGDSMYRTGDLGRYRPDGTVDFIGRTDDQVKIRGHRVEPAEIESILRRHDAIGEALAIVQEREPGNARLVAYVVAGNGRQPDARDLRLFLKEWLPEFMIPSAYVILDRLPLTPNGKIDRDALPAPDAVRRETRPQDEDSLPRSEAEKIIAEVWRELLHIEHVTVFDNFLDLGGHSLLGLEVIARVQRRCRVEVHPRELMFQSLGQIAASCTQRMNARRAPRPAGVWERVFRGVMTMVGLSRGEA